MSKRYVGALLTLLLVLAACGGGGGGTTAETPQGETEGGATEPDEGTGEAQEPASVNLALATSSPAVGQATYTSLPEALGFWEDEAIDVEINGLAGSSAALQSVDGGQSDVAVSGTSAQMLAVAQGSDLVSYYTLITRSFQTPAVPEDSDIQSIAELEGKTIGVQSLESGTIPIIKALVESEGVDPESIQFVAVGLGAEALSALQNDRVDALGLWDDRYADIENLGQPLRILTNDLAEKLGFQVALVTTPGWLEDGDVAVRFARAMAKGSVFADENPEAAVRLHWELYPDTKPVGVEEETALEQGVRSLTARMDNSGPVDGQWGLSTMEQVKTFRDLLVDTGTVDSSVTAEQLWNGDFIDEINDFDEEAIREMARNWNE